MKESGTPARTTWPASVVPAVIEGDDSTHGLESLGNLQRPASRPRRHKVSRALLIAAFWLISAVVAMIISCHKAIGRDPLLFKAVRRLAGEESEGADVAGSEETESCLDQHEYALLSAQPEGHSAGSQAQAYETGEPAGVFTETGSLSETGHRALGSEDPESNILRHIADYRQELEKFEVDASAIINEPNVPSYYSHVSPPREEPPRTETASPKKGSPFQAIEGSQLHLFAQSGAAPSIALASELSGSVGIKEEHGEPQTAEGSGGRRRVRHVAESVESEVPEGLQATKRRRTPSSESKFTSSKRKVEDFMAPTSPSGTPLPADVDDAETKDDIQQATTAAKWRRELSFSALSSSSTTSSPASAAAIASAYSPTPSTLHAQSSAAGLSAVAGMSQVLQSGASDASTSGTTVVALQASAERYGAEETDTDGAPLSTISRKWLRELSFSFLSASPATSSPKSAASIASVHSPTPSTSHAQSSAAGLSAMAGVVQVLLSGDSDASTSGRSAADSQDFAPRVPSDGLLFCRLPELQEGKVTRKFRRSVVFSDESSRWEFRAGTLEKVFFMLLKPTVTTKEGNLLVKFGEDLASFLTREHKSPVNDEDATAAVATLARRYLLLDALLGVTRVLPDVMNAREWWAEHMGQIASGFPLLKLKKAKTYSMVALGKRLSRAVELLKQGQSPPESETVYLKTVLLLKDAYRFRALRAFNFKGTFDKKVVGDLVTYAQQSQFYEQRKELLLKSQAVFALPCSPSQMLSGMPVFYRLPASVEDGVTAKFQKNDPSLRAPSSAFGLQHVLNMVRLFDQMHLSADDAARLIKICQHAVSYLEKSQQYPVDEIHLEAATRCLAIRYLLLEALFCTIQLMPAQMNAQNWWIGLLKFTPTKLSGDAADSEEDQRLAQLAKKLGDAMELLKRGVRPALEETVSLKNALLLDAGSPLGLSPHFLSELRKFAAKRESTRHLD